MTQASALAEVSDFPVAVVAGTVSALLLFLIILIVVVLVAVGYRRYRLLIMTCNYICCRIIQFML